MKIEEKKQKILAELAAISDTDERYRYIINKGRALPEIPAEHLDDKFLIQGCISKAWLIPEFREGRVYFRGHSEAAIVKGIVAILIDVYSGNAPQDNLSLSPEFLREGGITEHLSLNRRNGLSSVVKQMMLYAAAYKALATKT